MSERSLALLEQVYKDRILKDSEDNSCEKFMF